MKKTTIITLLLFSVIAIKAQNNLAFNKLFIDSEDHWICFPMDEDSTYSFGFIYIDSDAGLTLNHEGHFKIMSDGKYVIKGMEMDSISIRYRLEPNNVKVAFIPASKFEELGIDTIPSWLAFYKTDEETAARQYKWGFMYNAWQKCDTALVFLEKAYAMDPTDGIVATELAYSYNCLSEYKKASELLFIALETKPKDAYTNKEYIYSLTKSGELEKAETACLNASQNCKDKTFNPENHYNILAHYYLKRDKTHFNAWYKKSKKWLKRNPQIKKNVEFMKKEISK